MRAVVAGERLWVSVGVGGEVFIPPRSRRRLTLAPARLTYGFSTGFHVPIAL